MIGVLALLLWSPVQTAIDVAAVQNAVQRDWEISFGYSSGQGKPAGLPASLDSAANSLFGRVFAGTKGYNGTQPTKTRNRDIVSHERFRALFRGQIRDIHIYYFEAFRGDLGAVLARFPELRRVTVFENEPNSPTESQWTLLASRLRALPRLEEIELGGAWVTDAAIAPLAGHPGLRVVTILDGRLSPECTKIFVTMPRLSKLHIEGQRYEGDTWLAPTDEKMLRTALPRVTIEVP